MISKHSSSTPARNLMRGFLGVVLASLVAFVVMGCDDQGDMVAPTPTPAGTPTVAPTGTPAVTVTFSTLQTQVFTPSCALSNCHADDSFTGLSLAPGEAYSYLVGEPAISGGVRVVPGNVASSVLIERMEAADFTVMPPTGNLPDAQIELVRQWIREGALDN